MMSEKRIKGFMELTEADLRVETVKELRLIMRERLSLLNWILSKDKDDYSDGVQQ